MAALNDPLLRFAEHPDQLRFVAGRGADHLVTVDPRSPLMRAKSLLPSLLERVPGSGEETIPLVHVVRLMWPVFKPTEAVMLLPHGGFMVLPDRIAKAVDDLAASGVDFGAAPSLAVLAHQIKSTVAGWPLGDPRTTLAAEHMFDTQAEPGGRNAPDDEAKWASNVTFGDFAAGGDRLGSLTVVYGVFNPILAADRYANDCQLRVTFDWLAERAFSNLADFNGLDDDIRAQGPAVATLLRKIELPPLLCKMPGTLLELKREVNARLA